MDTMNTEEAIEGGKELPPVSKLCDFLLKRYKLFQSTQSRTGGVFCQYSLSTKGDTRKKKRIDSNGSSNSRRSNWQKFNASRSNLPWIWDIIHRIGCSEQIKREKKECVGVNLRDRWCPRRYRSESSRGQGKASFRFELRADSWWLYTTIINDLSNENLTETGSG